MLLDRLSAETKRSITLHKEIIEEQPFNELAWFNLRLPG
jgi:hypothetical protein